MGEILNYYSKTGELEGSMEKKKMHLRIASVYGKSTNILQITV